MCNILTLMSDKTTIPGHIIPTHWREWYSSCSTFPFWCFQVPLCYISPCSPHLFSLVKQISQGTWHDPHQPVK